MLHAEGEWFFSSTSALGFSNHHSPRGFPMPQEFLRDVVRTGDTARRRQRHWSVLPLSIAGHAVVVAVLLFSPWAGSIDLPMIASPLASFVETVAPTPPSPPTPPAPGPTVAPPKAPIAAPTGITPDLPTSTAAAPDGAISNGPGVESGPGVLHPFGTATAVTPPPPLPPPTPKLVRVGGMIREPRKILHVAPIYPEIARQVRAQGTVTLECMLDATGRVESVRVLGSQPLLDDAAVMAVRQWRYTPTELNGVPVPVLMTIFVRFSLDR
jgi:protein TonB